MLFRSMLCLLLVGCHAEIDVGDSITGFFTRMTNEFTQMFDPDSEYVYNWMAKKQIFCSSCRGLQKLQPIIPDSVPFPCDTTNGRSPIRPSDVDHVAPGDIDVIAAIGDSLTTANGARAPNVLFISRENRGLSWSIGGQETWRKFLTLPNILRLFNPNLIGFSESSDDSQFNGAESTAISVDLPSLTRSVVDRILNDSRVDVENDWKLVTIMIGSNDFCKRICFSHQGYRDAYTNIREYMTTALDYIRDNLPRTIVNVVLPPILDTYRGLDAGFCHMAYTIQCPCLFGGGRQNTAQMVSEMQRILIQVQEAVAEDERYRREDFAVVVQPFMKNISVTSKAGEEFFSKTLFADDCIHFSQKGHATAANALWNNMLQPVGQKAETWTPLFNPIICPVEEHPYIFTYNNSPNETVTLQEARMDMKEINEN